MTQLESAVWRLFKEYFGDKFVKNANYTTLIGIRNHLESLLAFINKRMEQFE